MPGGALREALVLTGTVPSQLRLWDRAVDGRRIGLVDFSIYDNTGASVIRHDGAAVPEQALRVRETERRR